MDGTNCDYITVVERNPTENVLYIKKVRKINLVKQRKSNPT